MQKQRFSPFDFRGQFTDFLFLVTQRVLQHRGQRNKNFQQGIAQLNVIKI
jgi:hypothetical protein